MKLLALDIDDTTLCHNGTLSEKNKLAIEKVKDNGGYVVIITGRSPMAAKSVWERIPANDICVCFGGAVLYNMRTDEVLDSVYMDAKLLHEALDFAGSLGLVSQIYRGHSVITEYENPNTERYMRYLKLGSCIIEPKLREKRFDDVTKMLCFSPAEKLHIYMETFKSQFGDEIGVSASTQTFIEINDPRADKGTGLRRLCDLLNVDIKETVAMGDSLLDLPMLLTAGIGVAVENAHKEVLEKADIIAPDCDKDAVAWVVEKYFN